MYDMPTQLKPSMYISSKDLPELKKWKVGESYDLIVNVKQTSLTQNTDGTMEGRFEIQNIISAEKDPMDMETLNEIDDNDEYMKKASKIKAKHFVQ